MSAHTKGPIKVEPCTGYSHYVTPKAKSPEEHVANSRRLEALWTACEGIENPEAIAEAIQALRFYAANAGKTRTVKGAFIECDPDAGPLYATHEVSASDDGERAQEALAALGVK